MRITIGLVLIVTFAGCATASTELRLVCEPAHPAYAGGARVPVRVTYENVSGKPLRLSALSLPWQWHHAVIWRLAAGEWLTDPRLVIDPGQHPDAVLPPGGRASGEVDLATHLKDVRGRALSLFAGEHQIVGTGTAFVRDPTGKQTDHRLACGPFMRR